MDSTKNISSDDEGQQLVLNEALRYAAAGMRIFPVNADKRPLVAALAFKDASSDPAVIEAWLAEVAASPTSPGRCPRAWSWSTST